MKKILIAALFMLSFAGRADATCQFAYDTWNCLSTDTKPAANDRVRLYESDTRKHFLRSGGAWQDVTDHANLANKGTIIHSDIDDHVGSTVKHVTEGDKVLLNSASTGVLEGCLVTKNADPVYFDVTECIVRFVDNTTDPLSPTTSTVYVSAQSHVTVTNMATWEGTYLGINTSGNIVQQQTAWTPVQYRSIVPIAFLFHANNIDIKSALTHVHAAFDPSARLEDLSHSIGIMNLSGNQYGANGVNLNVNKSAGSSHASGANFQVDPKTPDITTDPSMTPMPAAPRSYRDGTGGWSQTTIATLNPNNYDDGTGTLPAVPAGNWIAIPLYYIPGLSTDSTGGARVQYPQRYFATKAEALAELPDPLFIKNPNLFNGTIRTYCVVQQGTTDLSDTAKAEFVPMGKFSEVSGGAGAGGGGAPTDGEYVTYSANTLLTNERVLTDGTNTMIDTGTAGQAKVNLSGTHADSFHTDSYSGVGACGANLWASTLNDNAAPTCTQPAFSNLSGRAALNQITDNDTTASLCLVSGGAGGEPNYITCPGGGGGDSISVNGTAAVDADLDDATPAAPANALNVKWQKDALTPNNVSANVPYAAPLTVTTGNLTIVDAAAGAKGAIQLTGDLGGTAASPTVVGVQCSGTCVGDAEIAAMAATKLTFADASTTNLGKTTPATVTLNVGHNGTAAIVNTLNIAAHAHSSTAGAGGQIATTNLSGTITDAQLASNYSGVGACGANTWASTLNDNAAPTCTQPGFTNLSGTATDAQLASSYSGVGGCTNQFPRTLNDNAAPTCASIATADLPTIDISKGGTTETASTEDAVLVGASTTDWVPKVLPSCSNGTTDKLLYDTATNTFSCGVDQAAGGGPITAKLTADYTNSTTTGTNVSGLNVTLAAGTYRFSYFLAAQAATIANAFDFGVNFTGTSTLFTARLTYSDTGTSATSGIIDDVITGDGGELLVAQCVNTAYSTTVPNLNCIISATTANTNMFVQIQGMIVVTVSGTFQLYAASESTTAIRVMTGSNLLVQSF